MSGNRTRVGGVGALIKALLTLLAVVVALAADAGVARAAAPRIVIVSGKPLERQVVISDWGKIFTIVDGIAGARPGSRAALTGRPRLRLSLFWGPRWNDYVSSGRPAAALRPWQADQFGGYYPAWRGRRAMIDLPWAGRWPRPLSAKALAVLERSGVPTRIS